MASDRQYSANRQNALRSTGPRTEEGKIRSSANATTHGLSAQKIIIEGEDHEEYAQLYEALLAEFAAKKQLGALGQQLVGQLASTLWRLRRIPVIEAAIYDYLAFAEELKDAQEAADPLGIYGDTTVTAVTSGIKFGRVCELVVNGGDALGKIARYEASLMRNWQELLHKLNELPAAPAPASALALLPPQS